MTATLDVTANDDYDGGNGTDAVTEEILAVSRVRERV